MSLLKEFDTDWSDLRPSGAAAQLSVSVTAEGIDMSRLNKHTAVLWTE